MRHLFRWLKRKLFPGPITHYPEWEIVPFSFEKIDWYETVPLGDKRVPFRRVQESRSYAKRVV
jgi:hypothetical protein